MERTMKAMILKQFGGSDSFEAAEIEKPEVKAGHVLVKVAATSVNTVDTMICSMGEDLAPISPELPAVLGMDFAGTVEAIGEGVSDFSVGDEVYGCAGGLAELSVKILELAKEHGRLTVSQIVNLTNANRNTVKKHLQSLVAANHLSQHGAGKGTWYGRV